MYYKAIFFLTGLEINLTLIKIIINVKKFMHVMIHELKPENNCNKEC